MDALTDYMRELVALYPLGFVATTNADGTPNLSPKGTCLVLDAGHLMFGEIRSPNTLRNLQRNPAMEINFIDFLARKGFRTRGEARFVARGETEFAQLIPRFAQWGELAERINGIVILAVREARLLTSPAYDLGATEEDLRAHWTRRYLGEPGGS